MALVPYESPYQREQQVYRRGMQEAGRYGLEGSSAEGFARSKKQAAANTYGKKRMNQLQRVSRLLSPELQALMGQQNAPGVDPAAAWRAVSGQFANAAKAGGYQDPRQYLQYLLKQRPGSPGQGGPGAGGGPVV